MTTNDKEILNFIKNFSKYGKQVKECFTENNCYYFALILKERFGGDIMYNDLENHFACRIKRKLYDISGCCDNSYYKSWEKWENYKLSKDNKIFKLEKEYNIN